MSKLKRF